MKTVKIFLIILCALLPQVVIAQGYTWQPLSANDAMQAIRTFEGDPSLALTVFYTPDFTKVQPGVETPYRLQSSHYEYRICAFCQTSFSRDDIIFTNNKDTFYGQPYDNDALAAQAMSQSSAQAIATAFMQAHYPNPSILTTITVTPHIASKTDPSQVDFTDTYEFDFGQDCGNGVAGPSDCSVEVDTVKGQIISYGSNYFPVLISSVPALSPDQAMASAMNMMQIQSGQPGTVDFLGVSFPDAFGVEHLIYDMTFSGTGPVLGSTPPYDDIFYLPPNTSTVYPQADQDYVEFVDANTGSVIYWSITLGSDDKKKTPTKHERIVNRLRTKIIKPSATVSRLNFHWANTVARLSYPPHLVHQAPYMATAYLGYGVPGVKLSMTKEKQVVVNGPGRQVSLHLNSQTYQVNGQTKQMSAKPIVINGRCYVPLDVMQAVLGGKWSYEAKTQTVRYDPPQVKQASK